MCREQITSRKRPKRWSPLTVLGGSGNFFQYTLQYNARNRDPLAWCAYTARRNMEFRNRASTTRPADHPSLAVPSYVHLQIAWVLTCCRCRWSISCSARCVLYVYCTSAPPSKSLATRNALKARAKETVESTLLRQWGRPNLFVVAAIFTSNAITGAAGLPTEEYRYCHAVLGDNCRAHQQSTLV